MTKSVKDYLLTHCNYLFFGRLLFLHWILAEVALDSPAMKKYFLVICWIFFSFPVWSQEAVPPIDEKVDDKVKTAVDTILEEKGDLEGGPLHATLEGAVNVNYVFADSPDGFVVTYNFKIEETLHNKLDVRKGTFSPTTSIKGFLAKWPSGECNLKITAGSVPYELTFHRTKETEAQIDFKTKETILESWESLCNFADAPGAKFNTRGNPEKWLDSALKKTSPSLHQITLTLNRSEPTTVAFKIERYQAPDLPIGTVEIEGAGTITVEPK